MWYGRASKTHPTRIDFEGGRIMAKYIMAFDAGTTSNRCILFDRQGQIQSSAQKEFNQIFPKPGWV